MSDDAQADGNPEHTREGIAALRAWFFKSVLCINDSDDITRPYPDFSEIDMIDKMDEPPPYVEAPPPGAMSLFEFYKAFEKHASMSDEGGWTDLKKEITELAMRARHFLKLSPNDKTVPDINVGVRFLFHLSHALKTLETVSYKFNKDDPCVVVNMPLDAGRLSYIVPPCLLAEPSEDHKALWIDQKSGEYNGETFMNDLINEFMTTSALAEAFPRIKLGVICPSCKCKSRITDDIAELTESKETYTVKMSRFNCRHCGLQFSCLNPNVQVFFIGIRERKTESKDRIKC